MTGVLLDANLLLLLIVGSAGRHLIGRHKRLRAFSQEDFDQLRGILRSASVIQTSPNVLTECSNLSRQIEGPARRRISEAFHDITRVTAEVHVQALEVTPSENFLRLGLTDAILLSLFQAGHSVLLTADLDLFVTACGIDPARAVNWNHLREKRLKHKGQW